MRGMGKVQAVPKVWLNQQEACRYLGVTRYFLMEQRFNGQLPTYKVGGRLFFKIEDIDKMMRKGKTF